MRSANLDNGDRPSGPQILIVHPKVKYFNPTTELWPQLFARVGQVTFFGPGHQPVSVLERGLGNFIAQQDREFDFVVVSEHVTNTKGEGGSLQRARFLARNYGYRLDEALGFLEQKASWVQFLQRCDIPTILTFFEFDPYRVYPEWSQRISNWDAYLLGWGTEIVRPVKTLTKLSEEAFSHRATDLWFELLRDNESRVISMPAFVDSNEFHFSPLASRKADWSILGTNYAARRAAKSVAREHRLRQVGSFHGSSVAVIDRITRGRVGNGVVREWMRWGFRRSLRVSRASYTCGSGLEYPIRKTFEIPAAGSLLVMRGFESLAHLGFLSEKNMLAAEPDDLPGITADLLYGDPDKAQAIATAGQALVEERHSLNARTAQLSQVIAAIVAGDFRGSCWQSGEFQILTRPDNQVVR